MVFSLLPPPVLAATRASSANLMMDPSLELQTRTASSSHSAMVVSNFSTLNACTPVSYHRTRSAELPLPGMITGVRISLVSGKLLLARLSWLVPDAQSHIVLS